MKYFLKIIFFTFLISFINIRAIAASFDCQKATSYTEKTICADISLGELDETMATKYKYAVRLGKEVIRNEQREWLKNLKSCQTPNCISNSYNQRLSSLDEFINMSERQINIQSNFGNIEKNSTIKEP